MNLSRRSLERRRHRWQTPRYEERLRVLSVKRDDLSRPWQATDRSVDVAPHEAGLQGSHEPGAADRGERPTADGTGARWWRSARHQTSLTRMQRCIPLD